MRTGMYCIYCGSPLPAEAKFCRQCGKSQPEVHQLPTKPPSRGESKQKPSQQIEARVFLVLVSAILLIVFLGYWKDSLNRPTEPPHRKTRRASNTRRQPAPVAKATQAAPEIDISRIALARKDAVEKLLGRPNDDRDPSSDFEGYSWGFAAYESGRLTQVDYEYRNRPLNVRQALERVGLKKTSEPRKTSLSYFWNSTTGPLICCGFEFDNVVLLSDFSRISVGVKRRMSSPGNGEAESQNGQ
jgi:hypothetical protein